MASSRNYCEYLLIVLIGGIHEILSKRNKRAAFRPSEKNQCLRRDRLLPVLPFPDAWAGHAAYKEDVKKMIAPLLWAVMALHAPRC